MNEAKAAVLLVNLGSPEAPTRRALHKYLREFLLDKRVIDLPRWQWWPILYGIILRFRPRKSAKAYAKIWHEEGAPLRVVTERQAQSLQEKLTAAGLLQVRVAYAMRYGEPALSNCIAELQRHGVEQILVIPMYPQYADATTASVCDGVFRAIASLRHVPALRFVHNWHDHPEYINALAARINAFIDQQGCPEKLLFSFHGEPQRYIDEGDPYAHQCQKTIALLTPKLKMAPEDCQLVFQSRFGREAWLKPYADHTIAALADAGTRHIAVVCPGFSSDCLETLEEMALTNRALFFKHGGQRYDYIPCLNDDPAHIDLLATLARQHGQGWAAFQPQSTPL